MQADHEYRVEALKIHSQLNSVGNSRIVGGKVQRPTLRGGGGALIGNNSGRDSGSGGMMMNDLSEGMSSYSMNDHQHGYDPSTGSGSGPNNKYPSFSPAPRASATVNYPDFSPAQPITNSASLRNTNNVNFNNNNNNSDASSVASSKGNSMFSRFMKNNK